ncbi:hypothetical protein ACS0TY_031811 [Phlomoides rotata]
MQEALFYGNDAVKTSNGRSGLKRMVEENAVVVIARKGCCMSQVVQRLLHLVGANPAVYKMEEREVGKVAGELAEASGGVGELQFPAVFIGGRWFGGVERVIATHITEELTPLLKSAGALWL